MRLAKEIVLSIWVLIIFPTSVLYILNTVIREISKPSSVKTVYVGLSEQNQLIMDAVKHHGTHTDSLMVDSLGDVRFSRDGKNYLLLTDSFLHDYYNNGGGVK